MLKASKLALDRSAAAIERSEARRLACNERVEAVALDSDERGLALAGQASATSSPCMSSRLRRTPVAMLARRRLVLAEHDAGVWAKRDTPLLLSPEAVA